jgi:putative nucleotidyltransferase with HDIG domain
VAVALSNANLIEALDKFNWGTLKALARTVDTKSSWTAGHSERVTELALKIGKALKLSRKELDNLQRGGLLHDIGKLGVPVEILDKPGRLTNEELEIIKQHPITGARILEPISAYEDVIPIGLQHHERFDGTGYPYGTSGEEICLGARIMAVADVYDALISDRPYRAGIEKKRALEFIKKEAGKRFDPQVVNAFSQVIEQEEGKKEIATDQTKKIYRLRDKITRRKGIAAKTI